MACRASGPVGRWLGLWGRGLEGLLLPVRCPVCGDAVDARHVVCADCRTAIPVLDRRLCVRCLVRGDAPAACSRHPGFDVWAAWLYDPRVAFLVHALKFEGRERLARSLGERVARSLPMNYRPDLVLDVPLHEARRRERGFNQAARLADAVAGCLAAPRLTGALRRGRATRPQTALGGARRRRNVEGAFVVTDAAALRGREVLIVDDVVTTGSTLHACLDSLAGAGALARAAVVAWAQ